MEWKDILIMILGESIILTLVAAVVGIILGVVGSEGLLALFSTTGSFFKPVFTWNIVLRAFAIALIVGILGGVYPAYGLHDYHQRRRCAMSNGNIIEIRWAEKKL